MPELECLFAAPGAANSPEAVQYVRFDDQVYIAYASGPGVVICKHDLSLYTTLAFDDAFPSRASAISPGSTDGLAVDSGSTRGILVAWRGKQAAIWIASSTKATRSPSWKTITTLSIDEDILSLSISSNMIILGTSRSIECWTVSGLHSSVDTGTGNSTNQDIPILDCLWTRSSSGPCSSLSFSPSRSHIAWTTLDGSEAYVLRLKADGGQEGLPQVLKHSKRLARVFWRTEGSSAEQSDISGHGQGQAQGKEPCLVTQTVDSSVRLYKPVLDDPYWFQLVAALDLNASMRKLASPLTPVGSRGKAPASSSRRGEALPFVLETIRSGKMAGTGSSTGVVIGKAKGKEVDKESETTFIAWTGEEGIMYSAEVKGLDRRPPQLVQIKLSKPAELDPSPSDPSTRTIGTPGALRFIAAPGRGGSGMLLAVPPRTPGLNAAYAGLAQYHVQADFAKPSTTPAKATASVPPPGMVANFRGTIAQGFQPRAKLLSAGPDGHLLFESRMSSDRVLDIALRHADAMDSGKGPPRWWLEEPDVDDERVSDKGLRSMKVFEKAGIRLSGSAAGLRLDRRVGKRRWQEVYTLERSEAWESWSAVYPYELRGMGQTLGCFDVVVIAVSEDPWGLDGHSWRVTIDLEQPVGEAVSIKRETVTLPDPGQHAHLPNAIQVNGTKRHPKEWKNIPMSHKEGKTLKSDIHADGYWRVPCAFAVSDGSGEVILLDLAAYPDKAPVSKCMGHAVTVCKGFDGLKVYPQGVVLHTDKAAMTISIWRPSDRPPGVPEFTITSSSLVSADITTTDEGNLALAIGESSSIKVFCQSRLDVGRPRSDAWRCLARFDFARHTPYTLTGMSWLPHGEIALTASRQLLVAGFRSDTDTVGPSLMDLVDSRNAALPLMHPTNLKAALIWNQCPPASPRSQDEEASASLVGSDAKSTVGSSPLYHSWRRYLGAEGSSLANDSILTAPDRVASRRICQFVDDLAETASIPDQAGMRFLVSLRAESQSGDSGANWDSVVWGSRSSTQEALVKSITSGARDQRILWSDARRAGAFLWLTSNDRARGLAEEIARNQFLAADRDPIACSLLYFALGKKATVHGLWRQISGHAEQNAMLKFLINDFSLPRWQSAATKNAYALLGRQRYEYAAAFFVLAGQVKDAVNICVKHLKDWQLGLAIARLADPTSADGIFKDVLERIVLPLALVDGSRWLLHWTLLRLDRKDAAVAVIFGQDPGLSPKDSKDASSGAENSRDLDPALLALLADLKEDAYMREACSVALRHGEEMRFVRDCVNAYWRMGCRELAIDIMRDWKFEPHESMKRAVTPAAGSLANGKTSSAATFADEETFKPVPKTRSDKAGVMAIGEMKDSKSSQGAVEFDMGSFF